MCSKINRKGDGEVNGNVNDNVESKENSMLKLQCGAGVWQDSAWVGKCAHTVHMFHSLLPNIHS